MRMCVCVGYVCPGLKDVGRHKTRLDAVMILMCRRFAVQTNHTPWAIKKLRKRYGHGGRVHEIKITDTAELTIAGTNPNPEP